MKYIQKQRLKYTVLSLITGTGSLAFLFIIYGRIDNILEFSILTVLYIFHIALLIAYFKAQNKFKSYDKGSIGEQKVSNALKKIDQVSVLNSVVLPNINGNIDHIAFLLGTIFLIETKHYSTNYKINKKTIFNRMNKVEEYIKAKFPESRNTVIKMIVYTGNYKNLNTSRELKEVPLHKLEYFIREYTRVGDEKTAQLIEKELKKYSNS